MTRLALIALALCVSACDLVKPPPVVDPPLVPVTAHNSTAQAEPVAPTDPYAHLDTLCPGSRKVLAQAFAQKGGIALPVALVPESCKVEAKLGGSVMVCDARPTLPLQVPCPPPTPAPKVAPVASPVVTP
jgi:hypothetical protein